MPQTKRKTEVVPAPKWGEFTTAKDVMEALWQYMGDNSHFGAWDTEPKYDVRDAVRKFERVPVNMKGRWELYSTMRGVGKINREICVAVNRAIALTKEQGFGAKALEETWEGISGCGW